MRRILAAGSGSAVARSNNIADIWLPVARRKLLDLTGMGGMATSDFVLSMPGKVEYLRCVSAQRPRPPSLRVTSPRLALTAFKLDNSTLAETSFRFAVICRLIGLWGAVN